MIKNKFIDNVRFLTNSWSSVADNLTKVEVNVSNVSHIFNILQSKRTQSNLNGKATTKIMKNNLIKV